MISLLPLPPLLSCSQRIHPAGGIGTICTSKNIAGHARLYQRIGHIHGLHGRQVLAHCHSMPAQDQGLPPVLPPSLPHLSLCACTACTAAQTHRANAYGQREVGGAGADEPGDAPSRCWSGPFGFLDRGPSFARLLQPPRNFESFFKPDFRAILALQRPDLIAAAKVMVPH